MQELLALGYSLAEIKEGRFMASPPANSISSAEIRERYVALNRSFLYLTQVIKSLIEGSIPPNVEVNGKALNINPAKPTEHVPFLFREVLDIENQLDMLICKTVVDDPAKLLAAAREIGLKRLDKVSEKLEARLYEW